MHIEEGTFKNNKDIDLKYRLILPDDEPYVQANGVGYPVVVLVHGFGGSINSAYIRQSQPRILETGAAVFTFNLTNLRREGIDTGALTPDTALADLYAAMAFIKSHPLVDQSQIIGMGASFGAYTLLRYEAEAQDPDVQSLIFLSVVPQPLKPFRDQLTRANLLFWKWRGHIVAKIDGNKCRIAYQLYEECKRIDIINDIAPRIRKPVTIIQGDRDILGTLPDIHELHEALVNAPNKRLHVLKGAQHEFSYQVATGKMYSEFEQAVGHARSAIEIVLKPLFDTLDVQDPTRKADWLRFIARFVPQKALRILTDGIKTEKVEKP